MIENLVRVAPVPPGNLRPFCGWAELEQRLGFRLPSDYKALVETYGPGIFGGFIHVFQPSFPVPAMTSRSKLRPRPGLWSNSKRAVNGFRTG